MLTKLCVTLSLGLPHMSNTDYVIGIDCSTTATKAVVWNALGEMVSQGKAMFETHQPNPGWGEQNAEDWWTSTREAVGRATQSIDVSRIAAISIAHQRETFVCTDSQGRPLRPAMLWLDSRATQEVDDFGSDDVHRISGKPPNVTPAWFKLLWLQRHEPEIIDKAARVLDVQGFLVHRLTGEWKTSWGSADPLGLVDVTTFDYHTGLLQKAGLSVDRMCELVAPGEIVGQVRADVADELNLPRGIPVVAGIGDGQAAQVGTGAVVPGRAYLNLGSGVVSGTYSPTYSYSRDYRVLTAAVPGGYTLETFIGGGTFNLQWFVQKFAGVDPMALGLDISPEQVLETAAEGLPPGANGLMTLPYWTGALTPFWDYNARGAIIGLTGVHGKSHIYRSLLEGIAFEQRFLTERAESALSNPIDQLVALGGGSKSRVWCQIISDVMQRPVDIVREPESTCLGVGVIAAVGVGIHASLDEAVASMTGTVRQFLPNPEAVDQYEKLYSAYTLLYPALRDVFPKLNAN